MKKRDLLSHLLFQKKIIPLSKRFNSRFDSVIDLFRLPYSKRSQISIFIIFAIVLLLTGVISFSIYKYSNKSNEDYFNEPETKSQVDNLLDSVKSCMELSADDSLNIIGLQGGYFNVPKESYDLGWILMPYYYYEGDFFIPDRTTIENELSSYYDIAVNECVNSIDSKDIEKKFASPSSKTNILKDNILFTTDAPLILKKDGRTIKYELKELPLYYPSKLNDIYELSRYIIEFYRSEPQMICVSCLNEMAESKKLSVEFTDFEGDIRSIAISDSNNIRPYYFEFLIKNKGVKNEENIIPRASIYR